MVETDGTKGATQLHGEGMLWSLLQLMDIIMQEENLNLYLYIVNARVAYIPDLKAFMFFTQK